MAPSFEFDYNITIERGARVFWKTGYASTSLRYLLKGMKIAASGKDCVSSLSELDRKNAAPIPWSSRAMMRNAVDVAKPQSAEAHTNTARPLI